MTMTVEREITGLPVAWEVHRLQSAYRRRGWTIWHGESTGQYWAAHTGRTVLVSGDSAEELVAEIERIQPRPHPSWRLVPRPRRRGA
ncbi:hypothetical protein KIK06_00950 [Nocardiopsis sp. EMB25]|uniref:hypothetical protein n=1 Tax=Nocardiopsis sp. EMB25 TaxID=2835867 RepID=UPI002285246B|nr:hypothetical protein [Nocardiopsis sp. EMB25]MCY9782455.1 hypothetical protein [Nocardiopsis sp. EMB25]